jgi:hypothetical protein
MEKKDVQWVKRNVKDDLGFFTEWLKIIKSYSPLTDKEAEFMAVLLTKRHELSKVILDESILSTVLFDKSMKLKMVEDLQLKDLQTFENMASTLRKKKVIIDNKINPLYIPKVQKDFSTFAIGFIILKESEQG